MSRPHFAGPNQCPACFTSFQDHTGVILTNGGEVMCAEHRGLIVAEAIFAEGSWRDIKKKRRQRAV